MRQGIPTPAGAVPEQRGHVTDGRALRRARETGGRATVSDIRAVCQALGGRRVRGGGDGGHVIVVVGTSRRRLRVAAGRVARVFAHVRQEGTADAACVLLSQDGCEKGEPQTLRQEIAADQEAQVQSAPVRRSRVVRRRADETVDRGDRNGQGVRVDRARAQRVRLLSRHAVRQTRRVSHPVQGQRELFRNLRKEVIIIEI